MSYLEDLGRNMRNGVSGVGLSDEVLGSLGVEDEGAVYPIHYTFKKTQPNIGSFVWPTQTNPDGVVESIPIDSDKGDMRNPVGYVFTTWDQYSIIDAMYDFDFSGNLLDDDGNQFRMLKTWDFNGIQDVRYGRYIKDSSGNIVFNPNDNSNSNKGILKCLIDKDNGPYLTKQVTLVVGNWILEPSTNMIFGMVTDIVGFLVDCFNFNNKYRYSPRLYYRDFNDKNTYFHASEYFRSLALYLDSIKGIPWLSTIFSQNINWVSFVTKGSWNAIVLFDKDDPLEFLDSVPDKSVPGARFQSIVDQLFNISDKKLLYINTFKDFIPEIIFSKSPGSPIIFDEILNFTQFKWLSMQPYVDPDTGKPPKMLNAQTNLTTKLSIYQFIMIDDYGNRYGTNLFITSGGIKGVERLYEKTVNK